MRIFLFLTLLFVFAYSSDLLAQYYDEPGQHECLKCHSGYSFSFHNEISDRQDKRMMNPYYVLDTIELRSGVHHVFDCVDCHSYDYTSYPHASELKLEPMMNCLDCHSGDEPFASYQFDRIDTEVQKSVHFQLYGEGFTCTKCHDPHTYKPVARNSGSVKEIVDYSNRMCLTCHADVRRFEMESGKSKPQLSVIHEWLPNQRLHFENVRCIECHTEVTDSLMVSHNIQPKEQALRNCIECHSGSSRLKASLYKYENLQDRQSGGLFGNVITNESYIIGTHQVPLLKRISYIIVLLMLVAIGVHIVLRIIFKK